VKIWGAHVPRKKEARPTQSCSAVWGRGPATGAHRRVIHKYGSPWTGSPSGHGAPCLVRGAGMPVVVRCCTQMLPGACGSLCGAMIGSAWVVAGRCTALRRDMCVACWSLVTTLRTLHHLAACIHTHHLYVPSLPSEASSWHVSAGCAGQPWAHRTTGPQEATSRMHLTALSLTSCSTSLQTWLISSPSLACPWSTRLRPPLSGHLLQASLPLMMQRPLLHAACNSTACSLCKVPAAAAPWGRT
jgi:hypothetical protein